MLVMDLNHPNLLTARHFDIWNDRPFLVFPFISGGSLGASLLNEVIFDEIVILQLMSQVCDALAYLHSKEILHQDIKPDNILVDSHDRYLLSDFGISSRLRSTLRKSTTAGKSMTLAYAPPERFDATPKNLPAGDVFSLGVLAYEMATGDLPWMGNGGMSLKTGADIPSIPELFSSECSTLITEMMSVDPMKRPSAKDAGQRIRDLINSRHHDTESPFKQKEQQNGTGQMNTRKTRRMEDDNKN